MKLHKSIKQYAKFNSEKLNELIEIDSYNFIKTIYDPEKYQLPNVYLKSEIRQLDIFKHKTENSYLVILTLSSEITYYYVNEDLKTLNRNRKPASIRITSFYISNRIEKVINLTYYKNNIQHNDYGPADLTYCTSDDKKYTLTEIDFLKDGKHYNKNGIIYYTSNHESTIIHFMKKDITTSFEFSASDFAPYLMVYKTHLNKSQKIICHKYKQRTRIYSIKYSERTWTKHRLDGPAFIKTNLDAPAAKDWYVCGQHIPDNVFHYEKGKEKNITKVEILKAILFNREYGEFLLEKFNKQKTA